jgi:hypothetical protein
MQLLFSCEVASGVLWLQLSQVEPCGYNVHKAVMVLTHQLQQNKSTAFEQLLCGGALIATCIPFITYISALQSLLFEQTQAAHCLSCGPMIAVILHGHLHQQHPVQTFTEAHMPCPIAGGGQILHCYTSPTSKYSKTEAVLPPPSAIL